MWSVTSARGRFGSRKVARAKKRSSSGGTSEVSISASENAATLAQSVLEIGVESLSLTAGGLSQGNDPDGIWVLFGEDNDDDKGAKEADSYRSILTVDLSSTWICKHGGEENLSGVKIVQTVALDVRFAFGFIPLEGHTESLGPCFR